MGPITFLSIVLTKRCCSSSKLPATPTELVTAITFATTSSRMATSTMTNFTSNYWGSVTLFWTVFSNMSSLSISITNSGVKYMSL